MKKNLLMLASRFPVFLLFSLLAISIFSCTEDKEDVDRARVINLLTNDDSKKWTVQNSYLDGVEEEISSCDSTYILTMRADFSWETVFLSLACYQLSNGSWQLLNENQIIRINYIIDGTGEEVEDNFEIVELSEDIFSYEYVSNNRLRRLRLRRL